MIDLHMHTIASDGALSVAELLQKCQDARLDLISITDHFTVNGYEDLKNPKIRSIFKGKILTGCEFTSHFKGCTIEILGYGIQLEGVQEYLSKNYRPASQQRLEEIKDMKRLYTKKGLIFDPDKEYHNRLDLRDEMMKYPQNRSKLTDPRSAEDATLYLRQEVSNPDSPFFRSREGTVPNAREVCEAIHTLGGKSFIAHPGIYHQMVYGQLESLIKESGVDGLEVWYPSHSPEQREYLEELCQKHHLLQCGGSDYHRPAREERGNIVGNPWLKDMIPLEIMELWIDPLLKI